MDLASSHVHEVLKNEGVEYIYHANTVQTACHFLRANALLSRGTVANRGLKQTPQKSDSLDKRLSIWFDIFTDSVDIHWRASNLNHYGPVLFVLNESIIDKSYTGRIAVTKINPTKWKGKKQSDRWFQTKHELSLNFTCGTFDHMIVFRHCGGELPLSGYLKEIQLDDPQLNLKGAGDLYSIACGALRLAMSDSGLNIPIVKRKCRRNCKCLNSYRKNKSLALEKFLPIL